MYINGFGPNSLRIGTGYLFRLSRELNRAIREVIRLIRESARAARPTSAQQRDAGRFASMPGDAAGLARILQPRRNELTEAAMGQVPEIAAALRRLAALPGALLTRMSGSGATCFALFADRTAAEEARTALAAVEPRWWCAAVRQRILIPPFPGSNPGAPANQSGCPGILPVRSRFCIVSMSS